MNAMEIADPNHTEQQESETSSKARYEAPKLHRYGTLASITGGPQGGSVDLLLGGNGGFEPFS